MTYATDKLKAHPDAMASLRAGRSHLLSVHLMPQNTCNQRCSFCSYRLPDNKNSSYFDEGAHLGMVNLKPLFDDFEEMGVIGVEVTGGGEPLAHPETREMWEEMGRRSFKTALVTNGTLLKDLAPVICSSGIKWARVSIDAGTKETYASMRKCPEGHFAKAWRAVRELREYAPDDPEFRLGAAFTLSNENLHELRKFCQLAKANGADNVRLSMTFSDQGKDYFDDWNEVELVVQESESIAEEMTGHGFTVHNQLNARAFEVLHPTQDYVKCPTKDLLCVVEGTGKVYTCCTFTGSLKGLYGNYIDKGFRQLWEENEQWRQDFDASTYCTCACLYRDRNLAMNRLTEPVVHSEFI